MAQRMSSKYHSPLDSYYSLRDKCTVDYFAKPNRRKHLDRGNKMARMKKKESLAFSPFPSASVLSESFAPTRLPSCHRPAFGSNMRPVRLRALALADTPNTDGHGGLFLLEDLDVFDLYQLENGTLRKPISGNERDGESDLPVIPDKMMPVYPRLGLNPRQSSVQLSRTIRNSASSSPSHRSLGLTSRESAGSAMGRTGKLPLAVDKHPNTRKIEVSRPLQDFRKILRADCHSNVHITMLYLGTGIKIPSQNTDLRDELKVFQQICGAENICVYKGHLTRREQFQFASRRHFGFPFSATIYVNGMVASRISWCCEHRHRAGFQQGRRSCFRVVSVKGGIPCYRCMMAQQCQKYKNNQTTEARCPGRKEDLDFTDDGSEKGGTSTSEYGSLRSDGEWERDGETVMSDTSPSNSDHEILKSKKTPACSGEDRRKSNLPYDAGQRNIKLKSRWALSETLKTNNTTQSLDSDGEGRLRKIKASMRKTVKKKPCQRAERVDNTKCSRQESADNDANTGRKLLEKYWKKGPLGKDRDSIDQDSGDSSDSGKGRNMRKKAKKKKVMRREARENAEVNGERFDDRVSEDVGKKRRGTEKRQRKGNDLEDRDVVSVTQNEAVEDEHILSTLSSGFVTNEAEVLDNNPNSVKGETPIMQSTERLLGADIQARNSTTNNGGTSVKDGTDVVQQVSIDKDLKREDALGRELKEERAEGKLQGSNIDNADGPGKKINQKPEGDKSEAHLDKDNQLNKDVALAAWVRVKLALALKCVASAWSDPELSETSEASRSEDCQESGEERKKAAPERTRIDEIGQLSPNELMTTKVAVYMDAASLAARMDSGTAAGSDSGQQATTEVPNRRELGPAQNGGGGSHTNSQPPWDVVDLAPTDWLKEGHEPCRFSGNRSEVVGNEDVTGENVPKQKPKGSEQNDERLPLPEPLEKFVNPPGVIELQGGGERQIATGHRSSFQPLDHLAGPAEPDGEHLPAAPCKGEPEDGCTGTKPGVREGTGQSADTEQLPAKAATENNEEEETGLIVRPRGQQAAGTLRKHVDVKDSTALFSKKSRGVIPGVLANIYPSINITKTDYLVTDTVAVLEVCKSVEELILRNTGLTDDLLEMLVSTLVSNSQSEVETINLNLNNLGPHSAQLLVQLLKAKPSVKCLLLYGNRLGDKGISILMNGLIDLFTAEKAEDAKAGVLVGEQPGPHRKRLQLTELDIGSNRLTNEGLKSVAAFLRLNPPLEYLGLSQNGAVGLTGWCQLFDILKGNGRVSHVLLDENVLGNEGAKHLAEALRVNGSLRKVDLDRNEIGDEGGLALGQALSSNPCRSLTHLSLAGNKLSVGVKEALSALLVANDQGLPIPHKS